MTDHENLFMQPLIAVSMECCFCTQEEKTQDWWTHLCRTHRAEYKKEKKKERLNKIRKMLRLAEKGEVPNRITAVCIEFGHSYSTMEYGREVCRRCGFIIASRERLTEALLSYHDKQISNSLQSRRYLQKLQHHFMASPKLFDEVTDSAKIANILYYMRYTLNHSDDTILRIAGMTPSVLNAYIVRYPAVKRNGKLFVLSQ